MYNPIVHVDNVSGSIISLLVDGKEQKFDLNDLLTIAEVDISQEMMKQASLYGFVGALLASAEKYMSTCKRNMEVGYAAADQRVRDDLKERGSKMTEAIVKSHIEQSSAYQAYVDDYDDAVFAVKIIKMLASALEMKANMLISLGALLRHEMSMTGMNIKEEVYTEKATKEVDKLKETIKQRRKLK